MDIERNRGVELGTVALVVQHSVHDVGALSKQRPRVGVVGVRGANHGQFFVPNAGFRLDQGDVAAQAEVVQSRRDIAELLAAFKLQAPHVGVRHVGPGVLCVHCSQHTRLFDGIGEALVEHTCAQYLTKIGEAFQAQIHVVDGRFAEIGIAFERFEPFKVEGAEWRLFTEHGTRNGAAVSHAQVGQLDGIQFAQCIGEVHAWHEVQFVQPTLKFFNLFFGKVVHHVNFPAADVHVRGLHAHADVA